jgi:hypothetical protein
MSSVLDKHLMAQPADHTESKVSALEFAVYIYAMPFHHEVTMSPSRGSNLRQIGCAVKQYRTSQSISAIERESAAV